MSDEANEGLLYYDYSLVVPATQWGVGELRKLFETEGQTLGHKRAVEELGHERLSYLGMVQIGYRMDYTDPEDPAMVLTEGNDRDFVLVRFSWRELSEEEEEQ